MVINLGSMQTKTAQGLSHGPRCLRKRRLLHSCETGNIDEMSLGEADVLSSDLMMLGRLGSNLD